MEVENALDILIIKKFDELYSEIDKDVNQAVEWIDKAIMMTKEQPRFWHLRQQSLIHVKAGKKKTAFVGL